MFLHLFRTVVIYEDFGTMWKQRENTCLCPDLLVKLIQRCVFLCVFGNRPQPPLFTVFVTLSQKHVNIQYICSVGGLFWQKNTVFTCVWACSESPYAESIKTSTGSYHNPFFRCDNFKKNVIFSPGFFWVLRDNFGVILGPFFCSILGPFLNTGVPWW